MSVFQYYSPGGTGGATDATTVALTGVDAASRRGVAVFQRPEVTDAKTLPATGALVFIYSGNIFSAEKHRCFQVQGHIERLAVSAITVADTTNERRLESPDGVT